MCAGAVRPHAECDHVCHHPCDMRCPGEQPGGRWCCGAGGVAALDATRYVVCMAMLCLVPCADESSSVGQVICQLFVNLPFCSRVQS